MAVWKSAFLHPFLDGNLQNIHARPGTLDVLPPVPITPTVEGDNRGFDIHPGQTMTYVFERPLEDVIGIDLHVDLRFPLQPGVQDFPLVTLGGGQVRLSMGHLEFIDPGFTPETGKCRIGFFIDGELVDFAELIVFHLRTTRFHVRWHTHGQVQVSHDGVLRAYQPSVAAGKAFTIDRLTIGGPFNAPSASTPRFLARRVYLKVLRRQDARDEIGEHLPIDPCGVTPTPCLKTVRGLHDTLTNRCRAFMAQTTAQLTRSWREGEPGSPFSPEAVQAHAAALAAARAFGAFLDRREPELAAACVREIGTFLDVLAAANREGYAQLLAELSDADRRLDPYCRAELEPLYAANATTLEPVKELFEATLERAKAAAVRPGGPHA